mmetsp:Transcript_21676/g.31872  ORF Transcript_21676/g.31872 Transcript_21676/m.31872 type:complete len:466 (-) Transcript_21676:160-1557(-)
MPRPPSKHGLERKYKSWRKGKSKKFSPSSDNDNMPNKSTGGGGGGGNGSLKNQLRSQRRLLSKLPKGNDEDHKEKRKMIETRIEDLVKQIQEKEQMEKERKNATKYHRLKFIEKQKIIRLQKTLLNLSATTTNKQQQHQQPILNHLQYDLCYITNYPNDFKYISIFESGKKRCVDDDRTKKLRMRVKQLIVSKCGLVGKDGIEDWLEHNHVTADGLLLEVDEGVTRKEQKKDEKMNQQLQSKKKKKMADSDDDEMNTKEESKTETMVQDDRFVLQEKHDQISKMAEEEDSDNDSSVQGDSDTDSDVDDADPTATYKKQAQVEEVIGDDDDDEKKGDDCGEAVDETKKLNEAEKDDSSSAPSSSDSSDSDSSSSSSDSEDEKEEETRENNQQQTTTTTTESNNKNNSDSEDDFFTKEEKVENPFKMAKNQMSFRSNDEYEERKDKSRGWVSQKQRPGQFKRKRERR